MKLCCIFNIPSLYREKIYIDLDRTYECEWYFEKEENDINLFDVKKLRSAIVLPHRKLIGCFYRMKGLTRRLCRRGDFDAYLMIGAPMCISIWMICIAVRILYPQKKIYFWTHGWYGKETWLEAIVKKMFLKLAHGIFVYGNYAKNLLKKQGFKEYRLFVIHNSLSYDVQLTLRKSIYQTTIYKNYFNNDNPVIIFIGRLTPVKQLDMLIDAIKQLKERKRECNLALVGDGSMRCKLEMHVKDLGIEDNVWFYGACYDEAVNAELIYNADLCVSPGNVGLTAIHVLMFGTPVITHDDFAYQMPEFESIQKDVTGDFFSHDHVESLVNTICKWLDEKASKREEVRQACFKEIDGQWNPQFQMKVIKSALNNG